MILLISSVSKTCLCIQDDGKTIDLLTDSYETRKTIKALKASNFLGDESYEILRGRRAELGFDTP